MSTRTKGRKNELEYCEILKARGYLVELTPPPAKFKKQQDFFGLFDILAFSKNDILFIQVKTNLKIKLENSKNQVVLDILEFKNTNKIPNVRYILANRIDGKSNKKPVWQEIEI